MKKITRLVIAFTTVLCGGSVYAQFSTVWNAQYQHTTSPGFSNEARRVAEDANGNIFVLADVTSDIDPLGVHGSGTYHYITLTKYSTTGAVLFNENVNIQKHLYVGFNNLSAFGLEIDAAGNVYAGYNSWFSGVNNFDVCLTKYSNNLARVWTNTYATTGDDIGIEMKLHTSGTLYAVLKSVSGTTTYSLIESVPSNNPATLVYSFPANSAVLNALALDAGQTAYVAGYSTKGGYKNALVGAINTTTNTLAWSSIYSPTNILGDDVANKITVGVDGNIYTVGTTYQGNLQGTQVLVLKNLPGTPRFDFIAQFGNPSLNDQGLFINAAENGWLYAGAIASNFQAFVYRFPSTGVSTSPSKVAFAIVPGSAFTAVTGITMTAMKVSSAKNIYITGGITATGPSGAFSCSYLNKASVVFGNALVRVGGMAVEGDFDHNLEGVDLSLDYAKTDVYWLRSYWNDLHTTERVELMDVSVPSPLREASQDVFTSNELNVSITPNPAQERVTINTDENMSGIEVLDITGNRVLYTPAQSMQTTLDVSSLATGIYFCKIRTTTSETIRRLIIK